MKIVQGRKEWIPLLKALWLEAFGDGGDTVELFFRLLYRDDRVWCVEENGVLAAAIYGIEAQLWQDEDGRGKKQPLRYLYAGAAFRDCRGKGYYGELMRFLAAGGDGCIPILTPAEGLPAYYEKLGFAGIYDRKDEKLSRPGAVCPMLPVSVLRESLPPGGYKEIREERLGKRGFIEWGEPYLAYVLGNVRREGGSALELSVGGRREILLAVPVKGCLNILETTIHRELLSDCAPRLLEYFSCNSISLGGAFLMSPCREWPRQLYFSLPGD